MDKGAWWLSKSHMIEQLITSHQIHLGKFLAALSLHFIISKQLIGISSSWSAAKISDNQCTPLLLRCTKSVPCFRGVLHREAETRLNFS